MESFIERSCSRRMCSPLMLGGVVIVFDVLKTRDVSEFKAIMSDVLKREEVFEEVSTITILGALDKVLHPMGFQIQVGHKSFVGAHVRAIEEEVSRRVESYVSVLQHSAEECEEKGVEIQVKVAVGAPLMNVLAEEISSLHATWAILARQLSKESKCFLKQKLSCKVAQIRDNLSLEILRPYQLDNYMNNVKKPTLVYSLSKPVPLPPAPDDESDRNSLISLPITPMIRRSNNPTNSSLSSSTDQRIPLNHESCSNPHLEASGCPNESGIQEIRCDEVMQKDGCPESNSEDPIPIPIPIPNASSITKTGEDEIVSSYSEMKIEPGEYSSDTSPQDESKLSYNQVDDKNQGRFSGFDSPGCSTYENVQAATDNFSFDNFIGEGGYGIVYRGKLNDGQLVAVKVQKETKAQSCAEFVAEVSHLRFARHANIVTLLGYCCKGNLRILVYEFIGNKSLEWHLFENGDGVLEWKQRYRVAVGAAKGLQFLHEECQGGPVVHCNIRPTNILLSHDFVPMLGDSGLVNSGTSKFDKQRKFMGNLGYVAPECIDSDVRCVKADVYAFGILLLQLISGRKPTAAAGDVPSIRQWALSLIKMLALDDLVDPGIGEAYCNYELYSMAKAAYLCLQTNPLSRPSIAEVLSILEGTNNHLRHVKSNLYPMIISAEAHLD